MSEIKKPTEKALIKWWAEQEEGDHACETCGKVDGPAYVQAQHPFYVDGREGVWRCGECIGLLNVEATEKRKAQLAATPRCSFCKRRGTFMAQGVLLCGTHKGRARAAQRREQGGGFAMTGAPPTADAIRRWAQS